MPSSYDPHDLPRPVLDALGIRDVRIERVHQGWASHDVVHFRTTVHGEDVTLDREVHDHGQGVGVLVYDAQRRVSWLVRQLRMGSLLTGGDPRPLEVPAGLIDKPGDAEATARREVLEEVGITLRTLTFVAAPYATPGAVTERITLFLGEADPAVPRAPGGGLADEHEEIEIVELGFDELYRMNDAGEIIDMKTMILVDALRRKVG